MNTHFSLDQLLKFFCRSHSLPHGLVAKIAGFHPGPGSIPVMGNILLELYIIYHQEMKMKSHELNKPFS